MMKRNYTASAFFRKIALLFVFIATFGLQGWGQVNIIPIRTGFADGTQTGWTDNQAAGITYVQLLVTGASSTTPEMNFNSYNSESLTFKARTFGGSTPTTEHIITVEISEDNGANWVLLGTRTPSTSSMVLQTAFNISSYNGTQVKVKFSVAGTSNAIGVGIDDITITGILAPTGPADPTLFAATTFSDSQINLEWELNGASNNVMVAYNTENTFGTPANATAYTTTDPISGGGTVIYNGNAILFNHTGLLPLTTYYYKAWSVDGFNLYSTGVTANAQTQAGSSPVLSVSTLPSFGNQCLNTEGGPNNFTITGAALHTDNVTVEALSGFSYSTTIGGTYTPSLSVTQSGGAFSQVIYVKFTPTLAQSYNGNIVVGGGGASNVNCAASGAGINTSATIVNTSPANITSVAADLGGNITAIGCSNATERGIYWSTTSGFSAPAGTKVSESGSYGIGAFALTVSSLPAGTTIYYQAFATNSGGTVYSTETSFSTIKAEPTNYVTTFTATANSSSEINLTWVEFDGAQIADNYLIKASTLDNITAPADGTPVADNAVIGDNSGAKNVAHGVASYSWSGLTANTTYYFAIYPYTNSGAEINFKTDASAPAANATTLTAPLGLVETFVNCSAGTHGAPSGTDISTALDTKLQSAGWTGSKIYEAGGEVKLGTSSILGYITTRTVDLSSNGGNFELTVDLCKYGSDAGLVQIFHAPDGVTFTQIGTDITPSAINTVFETHTLSITGGTVNTKIKISAKAAANNRFYIDNISIHLPPASILTSGIINDFGAIVVGSSSEEQNYTVSCSALTDNLIVTAPTGFEISKQSGTGFSSSISFTPSEAAATATVYVRFSPVSAVAYSANITHASTGFTTVNKAVTGLGIKPEPSNHVTSFAAGATTTSSITLNWIENDGTQAPDGYIILASTGTIINPIDGIDMADDLDLTNGAGSAKVLHGNATFTFSNCNAGTTYNFKIYPYTNSGSAIDYKIAEVPFISATTQPPSSIITVSTASLNFENVFAGENSRSQKYTVSGSGMVSDLVINAPAGFGITTTCGGIYTSSITLTPTTGSIPTTTIYVKFSPLTISTYSGNITHTATSAANQYVAVNETNTSSEMPVGYYTTATGTGATLKTNLNNIISNHTTVGYDDLWDAYNTTDVKPNGKVWDMYSDAGECADAPYEFTLGTNQCGSYSVEGDCYNREHSWPKSWFNDASPMYSDLFHVVPTDGKVNGERGNYAFGTVTMPAAYTSQNGSKRGTCSAPGYNGSEGIVFEPIDAYKGDFARNYFYMATCYQNVIANWHSNDPSAEDILQANAYPVFEDWFLNMLIQWHVSDPVDQKELTRNDEVYAIQGNRNPFIDYPQFVNQIWGQNPNQPTALTVAATSDKMQITWTKPAGTFGTEWNGVVVFVADGGANEAGITNKLNQKDGADFVGANLVFGSAAIYNGIAATQNSRLVANQTTDANGDITVTGLTEGHTYYITAYTYRTVTGNDNDKWSDLLADVSATANVANITGFTAISQNGQVTLNWTNPAGTFWDKVVVVASPINDLEAAVNKTNFDGVVNGLVTAESDWIGANHELSDVNNIIVLSTNNTNYFVYNGIAQTVTLTNLTNGTAYYFKAMVHYTNLASNHVWSTGVSANATPAVILWKENIETGTNIGSYTAAAGANSTWTKGEWVIADGMATSTDINDKKNDTRSVRIRNTGFLAMNFDKAGGAGSITIYHANYYTNTGGKWKLQISTNSGSEWYDVGTEITCTATLEPVTFYVYKGSNVRFKMIKTAGSGRINFDDITITDYVPPVSSTWNGTGTWSTPANWNNGVADEITNVTIASGSVSVNMNSSCNNLTIATGADVIINNTYKLTVLGNVVLESDATNAPAGAIVEKGTLVVTGTSTVNRSLSADKWHFYSLPVGNKDITSLFDFGTNGNIWAKYFDATTGAFVNMGPGNVAMTVGKGYAIWPDNANNALATGTLNSGSIVIPISQGGTNALGWNLIGNPYPSAIDWTLVDRTGSYLNNSTYFWNGTAPYSIYKGSPDGIIPPVSVNGGTQYIPAMQGVFVQATASGNLTLTNACRVHSTQTYFKEAVSFTQLKMSVSNGMSSDETVLRFFDGATSSLDGNFDASKLFAAGIQNPEIFTVSENETYAINSMPALSQDISIPLGLKTNATVPTQYTFTASQMQNFGSGIYVYLEDVTEGVITDLDLENTYTFTAMGNQPSRFVLRFTMSPVEVGSISNTRNVQIYTSQKTVFITNSALIDGRVELFNLYGELVFSTKLDKSNLQKVTVNQNTGTYLVKVVTPNGVYTQKVFIE